MKMDTLGEFCDNTALATSTGLKLVGDVIDLGAGARNLGLGSVMYLVIRISTAFTSGGAATVQFSLASDSVAAIAVDGSATTMAQTGVIALAALDAIGDEVLIIALPASNTYERYLGVLANVATAALTAGNIDAFLTPTVDQFHAYPGART